MLGFGKTVGYAIQILSKLNDPGGPLVSVEGQPGLPLPYARKICATLRDAGLISSRRGNKGGAVLLRPADSITLAEIILLVEGEDALPKCPLGETFCPPTGDCPLHGSLHPKWEGLLAECRRIRLSDLSAPGALSPQSVT